MPLQENFWDVWERYADWLFSIIYASVRNRADAEDILQDTAIRAVKYWDSLRDPRKVATWLAKIAHSATIEYVKKSGRELTVDPDSMDWITKRYSEIDIDTIVVKEFVENLDYDTRQIVLMRYSGLDENTIAEMMGMKFATVHMRLFRAKRRLRNALKGGDVR